eukprot:TRINITY_DN7705_c0_g1_i1.p1 TRINITY_DN7705_c0_g1~~TRINITY_DN7705_c0_g1_i1.p1  ORF type:complete len:117 (+),score=40.12 TRINITY_DN7705_c0_g1_i1:45-353(+)
MNWGRIGIAVGIGISVAFLASRLFFNRNLSVSTDSPPVTHQPLPLDQPNEEAQKLDEINEEETKKEKEEEEMDEEREFMEYLEREHGIQIELEDRIISDDQH